MEETNHELREKIFKANAEAHDVWASTHDNNVTYISRPRTRQYYWNLISSSLEKENVSIDKKAVLEIGCGTGTFTDLFILKGASSFTGIDLSPKMIEKAKEKSKRLGYLSTTSFYAISLEEFAINNECKFDIIQSSSFIHHLTDVDNGLKLINAMLKPNGVYIALHEEINNHKPSKIEIIDENLQKLFGYGGASIYNKKTRIKNFVSFLLKFPFEFLIKKTSLVQDNNIPADSSSSTINYIDYQLNKEFSLSLRCSQYGRVQPYCYLGFAELMFFGKPLNHEMLIMKK